mmetsp:Transcript_16258/g.28739  ORF Transcript_16258/g.28739 Transcript_16258/m.28739 type:complete len:100 (+) Transcript_16258:1317-1616(+)
MHQSINASINASINVSINQFINQSISQSVNAKLEHLDFLPPHKLFTWPWANVEGRMVALVANVLVTRTHMAGSCQLRYACEPAGSQDKTKQTIKQTNKR